MPSIAVCRQQQQLQWGLTWREVFSTHDMCHAILFLDYYYVESLYVHLAIHSWVNILIYLPGIAHRSQLGRSG